MVRQANRTTLWAGVASLLLVALFLTPIRNLDLWWHLDSGRWMLSHMEYLDREIRSFTMEGAHWPNFAWLFQVLVASLHAIAGDWGLLVLKGLVWWGIFLMLFRAIGRRGAPFSWLIPIAIFGWQLMPIMHLRPHLLEGLFLAATILLLQQPRSRAGFWLSALLILAWANVHASVAVGAAALALHWLLGPRLEWPGWRAVAARLPGAALVAALMFATPNGLNLLDVLFGHAKADYLAAYIREWLPPKAMPPLIVVALLAVPVVLLLRRSLLTSGELLMIVVFMVLAGGSQRFLYELALVLIRPTGALLGLGLDAVCRHFPRIAGRGGWRAGALLLLLLVLAFPPPWSWLEHRLVDYPVMQRRFPHVALAVLQPVMAEQSLRVWNTYGWGGWLGWASEGRLRVFIDGRTPTVFTEELMLQNLLGKRRPALLHALLEAWRVDAVVLERPRRPVLWPNDPQWQLVAYGAKLLTYVRSDLVRRYGLTVIPIDPYQPIERLDPRLVPAVERGLRHLLAMDSLNPLAWRNLAEVLAMRADAKTPSVLDQIGVALRRSLEQDPRQALTRVRLAQWLKQTGASRERLLEPLLPWALEASDEALASHEVEIARILQEAGRNEEALTVLHPVNPRRLQRLNLAPDTWMIRALAYVELGDEKRARRARDMAGWLVLDAGPPARRKHRRFLARLPESLRPAP